MTKEKMPGLACIFSASMREFAPFEHSPTLAVAVSGGVDSMALCLLAETWARQRAGRVVALTVDHGLRPESALEARQVAGWMENHGIEHVILTLSAPLQGNIQHAARVARYDLLEGYCRAHHILHLLTAHHEDDQAETVLLRLGRGSGVDGLSGIPAMRMAGNTRILRPLLQTSKIALMEYLQARQQPWLEDASNATPQYARNRVRMALQAEHGEALISSRLADTARHMARARQALEHATAQSAARYVAVFPEGYATLDLVGWQQEPEEIRLRVLAALLLTIGGNPARLRFDALQALQRALTEGASFKTHTLHGCEIMPSRKKDAVRQVLVRRENAHIAGALVIEPQKPLLWDNRFLVEVAGISADKNHTVSALGAQQAGILKKHMERKLPRRISRHVLASLPALWELEELVSVPHIGFQCETAADIFFTATFQPPKALAGFSFSYKMRPA